MNQSIIIIAALGVAGVCYGLYVRSKKTKEITKLVLTPENVAQIEMSDIVGYFKSLNLLKGEDKPFVAQGKKVLELVDLSESVPENKTILLLGVYGRGDEIKGLKALCCDNLGNSVKNVLGSDSLIVLA